MDDTPTPVGTALPEIIESLQDGDTERARDLMSAVLNGEPIPCICGCGHPEDNDSAECDT